MAHLNISDFGATPDAGTLATHAIQQAIDAAQPGDTVLVPQGEFVTGSVFLTSGITLYLSAGAVLLGSTRLEDYPLIDTRVAGIDMQWPAGLVNINQCQNVTVTGPGTLDGQGAIWWQRFWGDDEQGGLLGQYSARGLRWVVDYDCQRPRNIVVCNSQHISLRDFTSRESGFWNVHLCYSRELVVEGLQVINSAGPSTDGIDIDACEQVVVSGCTVSCNDDNICIKAGRGREAWQQGRSAREITIRQCVLNKGSGITLGSETSGGIERVLIEDNQFNGTGVGFRIKSARNRGGFIRDITVRNLALVDVSYPVMIQLNWFPAYSYADSAALRDKPRHWQKLADGVDGEAGLTAVSRLNISQIRAIRSGGEVFSRAFFIEGYPERPIDGLRFSAVDIDASEYGKIAGVADMCMENVRVRASHITRDEHDTYER